jgi:hypothetical protein
MKIKEAFSNVTFLPTTSLWTFTAMWLSEQMVAETNYSYAVPLM